MSDLLDKQNLAVNTLTNVMNHATRLGNISQSECRKMSDGLIPLMNTRDKESLMLALRNYGKQFPISFTACEGLIYQINS